jgi:hypothetical protein
VLCSRRAEPPDWLVEFHKKLWGKTELLDQIIRTVILNVADFKRLQNRLESLHPSRGSDDYEPQIVLGAKSDFLRSLETSPALSAQAETYSHCDPTASNDSTNSPSIFAGDADVDDLVDPLTPDIFPRRIRYMDLTVLGMKDWPRVPIMMLIRSEWEALEHIIDKRPSDIDGSVVLTGQPGIGQHPYP